jgi:hypothetical protein
VVRQATGGGFGENLLRRGDETIERVADSLR